MTNREVTAKDKLNLRIKIALVLSIIGCIPTIFLNIFRWDIADRYTDFTEGFLALLAFTILIITIIGTFIFFIRAFIKYHNLYAIIPFAIVLALLLINITGLPTRIAQYINFYNNYEARMEVVKKIESGGIYINLNDGTLLPPKYKYLSSGNTIYTKEEAGKLAILFIFYFGDENISGFIYNQSNKGLLSNVHFDAWKLIMVKKLKPHWFLVEGEID